jgi:hypothetical protein
MAESMPYIWAQACSPRDLGSAFLAAISWLHAGSSLPYKWAQARSSREFRSALFLISGCKHQHQLGLHGTSFTGTGTSRLYHKSSTLSFCTL